jgi:hypothetical protein
MTDHHPHFFDDDGSEINFDLIPKPDLCVTCKKNSLSGKAETLCQLTRMDQQGNNEFICDAYEMKDEQGTDNE